MLKSKDSQGVWRGRSRKSVYLSLPGVSPHKDLPNCPSFLSALLTVVGSTAGQSFVIPFMTVANVLRNEAGKPICSD